MNNEFEISKWFKVRWEITPVATMKDWVNFRMFEIVQASDFTSHEEKITFSLSMHKEKLKTFLDSIPKSTDV